MCGRDDPSDCINHHIGRSTCSAAVCIDDFADKQRNVLCLEIKILQKAFINNLYLCRPVFVPGVGFALMEQNTGDDSLLLSLAGKLDKSVVRPVTIGLENRFHPDLGILCIGVDAVLHESLDLAAVDSDLHLGDNAVSDRSPEHYQYKGTYIMT